MGSDESYGNNRSIHAFSEHEIMSEWVGDTHSPIVSICCSTFNHASWITEALTSFLSQRTSFPFEIVVRDDASSDGTSDVVHRFATNYPNIIKHVRESQNQFSKGVRSIHMWPELAVGKYIALCEGDDFWLTEDKLQKQVDLLEANDGAVMSVALTRFCRQTSSKLVEEKVTLCPNDDLLDVEKLQGYYFHTSTYVIRSSILFSVVEDYFKGHSLYGDTALRAILISKGDFVVLPEIVSVYRITGNGIWTSLDENKRLDWELRAAQRLSEDLSGIHARLQKRKIYNIRKRLLKRALKSFNVFEILRASIYLGSAVFRYKFS